MRHSRLAVARAGDGSKLLDSLDDIIGNHDYGQSLEQLLNRVLHYCDVCGWDFESALEEARRWHTEEKKND